jgi:hypothetical protein
LVAAVATPPLVGRCTWFCQNVHEGAGDAAVGAGVVGGRHSRLKAADLLAAVRRAVRVAVERDVVAERLLRVLDARSQQLDHHFLAGVLHLLQARDGNRGNSLFPVVLGSGQNVGGRDVQEVVAGVTLERAVLLIFDLLNDGAATVSGIHPALFQEAVEQCVVLRNRVGGFAGTVSQRRGDDFTKIGRCHLRLLWD